jgi:hypothetical protein
MHNGSAPATRADIGMRLVVAASSYNEIGQLMDEVGEAIEQALRRHHLAAAFDFTHFNTHPCKTMRMEEIAYPDPEVQHDLPAPALTQH